MSILLYCLPMVLLLFLPVGLGEKQSCVQYRRGKYWSYEWCDLQSVRQYRSDPKSGMSVMIGVYNKSASSNQIQVFSGGACGDGKRGAQVLTKCCRENIGRGSFIQSVNEYQRCSYTLNVCTPRVCSGFGTKRQLQAHMSHSERIKLREDVREMFTFGYDQYMKHAFPLSDLKPLSCGGEAFGLAKLPFLTLIDSLDTLVIMGNRTEFRRAVGIIVREASFDLDVSISFFETTIRVLGGLLSAHMLACDPKLGLFDEDEYTGGLLWLAHDLGIRLARAFETPTGIPIGTINLKRGIPSGGHSCLVSCSQCS
jgi:hypothetical protein